MEMTEEYFLNRINEVCPGASEGISEVSDLGCEDLISHCFEIEISDDKAQELEAAAVKSGCTILCDKNTNEVKGIII